MVVNAAKHFRPMQGVLNDDNEFNIILAACWAHDVIEDCRQTYNDVKEQLGERVADIVYALTNEKGRTRRERANDQYYWGIRETPGAVYVKLCDRIANMTYSWINGSPMFRKYCLELDEFHYKLRIGPIYDHMWDYMYKMDDVRKGTLIKENGEEFKAVQL
jgi:hypothetical protein